MHRTNTMKTWGSHTQKKERYRLRHKQNGQASCSHTRKKRTRGGSHTQTNKQHIRQPHTEHEKQKDSSRTQNKRETWGSHTRKTTETRSLSVCQPAIPYELRITNSQSKRIEKALRNPTNPKHIQKTNGNPLRNPKKPKKPKLWQTTPPSSFCSFAIGGG